MGAFRTGRDRRRKPCLPFLLLGLHLSTGTMLSYELRAKAAFDLVYRVNHYTFLFRPVDYVTPPGVTRIDALVGRSFGAFKVYVYGKLNSLGHAFLGTRLDYTLSAWDRRLQAAVQVRGFLGLNRESEDHLYFITHINYALGQKRVFRPGILEYGIKGAGGDAVMYLGPSLTFLPSTQWSLRLSYGFDVLDSSRLLYLKLYLYL